MEPPVLIAGDDHFRIVRRGPDDYVLESRDGQDAMGETRWREMSGNAAIKAMTRFIIKQSERNK